MGTAGLGLVLGGSFVVGCGCLPWWCRVFVPWCVLGCGAACVPCLACVWRTFLARACCCAGAGTHPLSGGPVWLHGGPCWRPAVARHAAVGCVHVGGGGVRSPPLAFPALSLCPSLPACPACPPSSYPLVGLGRTVGLGGLTWCFFPAGRRGLGSFRGRVARVVCRAAWLLFTRVHAPCVVARVRCPGPPGSCSPVCTPCEWCRVYGVLGLPAPVHRCARFVCGVACTVSWASRLLFTGVHALCVVLRVRRPGPPGSCSPVCTLCVWCCVYGVLGLPAPVRQSRLLLFANVHALCVVLRVRCPGLPGSCSPVRTLCVWCCVYGVLGLLAPVHRCARSVRGVACTASWASRLLFTGVHALCVVFCVRCPGLPGSCSPVRTPCVWCCVYGVLGLPAPVHRCVRSVCGVACTVSWASRLRFTGVHGLRVWCPGPPGSCSTVCTLCVWCCVYGVLGLPAPVHRCARSACGAVCTVSWASRLLFTSAHALRVVLRVRCPGPPGSCSPVCTLCVWCRAYGVLSLPAPVHRCARPVCGVVCTVPWASRLLFTGAHALRLVLRVRRPGPPGSCSPVCTLCAWCCVYGVLGFPAPVHRCAHPVCGVACTVSWAPWLLFTGAHALRVVLFVRCPGPPGSCSPVCTLCVWCCVYGVLGFPAPVHRCARSACTVSWAPRLLFNGVHALRVVLRVRCPGPPGSCSPVCTLCVWCCVYGVLGLPAPVHQCARPACGVACTVSWASRLLFTGVHALRVVLCVRCPGPPGSCSPVRTPCVWCCVYGVLGPRLLFTGVHALRVVLCVRCPGPPGSCSPVRTPCVWCCVYGVLGLPAPVHRCVRSVCGVARTASWASRLLFTGVHALCVVLCVQCPGPPGSCSPVCTLCVCVRCPGPPGSCSPVCTLCVWWCVYGVLGLPAPVHRCASSVCGVACAVSWAFWLVFTGVHALCVVLCVRCPGPPASCSPVCTLCAWCCVCRLALLRSCGACCVVRVVSWNTRFVFSGVAEWCGVCVVRCAVFLFRVLGLPAPVHRCACSVCCVVCAVWVWVRARVCHTVAASLRTPCFCGNILLYTLLPMASDLFFPFWTL